MDARPDLTAILERAAAGVPGAFDDLFAAVYDELRALAQDRLAAEQAGHTLQPTALVHETYLKLVRQGRARWNDRVHFLAVAGQAMRRILVDHARGRSRLKRGGSAPKVELEEALVLGAPASDETVLALDDALRRLQVISPEKAQVVELRFFGGLTHDECAMVLNISRRTVCRHWDYAQAWLYRELTNTE
jgi:RNA polymerase sigma-70 factor, ECF subfamily